MIKTILVPATATHVDAAVFETAARVARLFGGHVDFLHVRVDAAATAAAASWGAGGVMSGDLIDRWNREAGERAAEAERQARAFCAGAGIALGGAAGSGITGRWTCEVGEEPDIVADFGRTSDLLVIGRPLDMAGVAPATLESALLASGRPLLIPGAGAAEMPAETVAIAWKPSPSAARAVAAALPFLARARRVVVLTVTEESEPEAAAIARLLDGLRRHHPDVAAQAVAPGGGSAAAALLPAAVGLGAGLLVMGGFGHSRLREFVFGGFTQHVLREAGLPVLMAH